jgi:hypothetical protein
VHTPGSTGHAQLADHPSRKPNHAAPFPRVRGRMYAVVASAACSDTRAPVAVVIWECSATEAGSGGDRTQQTLLARAAASERPWRCTHLRHDRTLIELVATRHESRTASSRQHNTARRHHVAAPLEPWRRRRTTPQGCRCSPRAHASRRRRRVRRRPSLRRRLRRCAFRSASGGGGGGQTTAD